MGEREGLGEHEFCRERFLGLDTIMYTSESFASQFSRQEVS